MSGSVYTLADSTALGRAEIDIGEEMDGYLNRWRVECRVALVGYGHARRHDHSRVHRVDADAHRAQLQRHHLTDRQVGVQLHSYIYI